jgi:hypothetical protein
MFRRHSRLDFANQHVETFGRKPAGLAHAREGIGTVNLDLPGFAQRRTGCIDISHGASKIMACQIACLMVYRDIVEA